MKNLIALEIFVTVAKLKNFTRAAEQLRLTKSTVSRQIQSLEKELGVTLIKRDPRHFSLTDEGSIFLKRSESIMLQTQEAFDEVSNIQGGLKGQIRISSTADLSLIYLSKSITKFSLKNPEIEFFLDLRPGIVDLKTEGFDMAVRAGHLKDSSLYAKKINEHQSELYASPAYLEKMGKPKSLVQLNDHKLIGIGKFNLLGSIFHPTIIANNMSVLKQLTLEGAGIGLISEMAVRTEKKKGELIQLLPNVILPKVPVHLVFPQKKMPRRISAFVQEIRDDLN